MAFLALKPFIPTSAPSCPCPGCNRPRCARPNGGFYSHCGNNCRYGNCNHRAPSCSCPGCNRPRCAKPNGGFYSHCGDSCRFRRCNHRSSGRQRSSGSGSNHGSAHIFPYLNYYGNGNHVLLGLERGGRYSGQLNFLGGKRDSGESDPYKTLSRELREEYGQALLNGISTRKMISSTKTDKAKLFVCKLRPGFSRGSFMPNGEIQSVHWVSIENLKGMKNFGSYVTNDSEGKCHTISKFVIENIFKLMANMK